MKHLQSLFIKFIFFLWLLGNQVISSAQTNAGNTYLPNIKTVRLHTYGDQLSMPIYKLNSDDRLELHFDDLDGDVKSYYYTYQLCDYDWQPVNLSPFDYIKGFTQQRISNYRYSSIAFTRYTHYQVILPEANSVPTKSGNYLLKVFLNGDTTNLAFTRRLLVLDSRSTVSAQMMQPFTPQNFNTHQRIKFAVNINGLNAFNPNQQIKVVVLQNYRWDNAQFNAFPTFIRGNTLEYNTENNFVFPGGKEWRWLDLRSLRLLSERIDSADKKKNSTDIFVKTDADRSNQRYVYYQDFNGLYQVTTYESVNPYWQGDYATVHFSFAPPNLAEYKNKELCLIGQLTENAFPQNNKMIYNPDKGLYESSLFLKQGYYSYGYMLKDKTNPALDTELDGNYWETENYYTILVYYKSFTDRSDQLIGVGKINTRTDRPGFSF
ncbi:DUF5103 domain-containing protein [Ferruginibacter lapsinanis]|uniref:type IX secretion system plug protein n=1 Tax=Ferruginibacter lapsinanis TaxID=563172 RepID=UPI001E36DEA3|nr:DUF5103 domain-containing protein [Ferruginibacter lapsinanis]UEG49331.1 DUF5103 domain-containing protein [Ferruginibacter lapsinanis]